MAGHGVAVGNRVRHRARPEWGIGQVLDVESAKAEVFFVEAGSKVISLRHVSLAILHPAPNHPLLDGIDAKAVGGSGYRSIRQCIEGFLKAYEGGFYGDAYLRTERDYKVEAHELATTILARAELEPLAASGAFAEICHRAMRVVNKTNLIFPNEKMDLKDGLKSAGRQRMFAVALYELLHGKDDVPSRFQRFAAVLEDMGAGKWTIGTYFPFLLFPDQHQFIKPAYTKNAATICAFEIGYTPHPDWPAYERMLRFSNYLKSELAPLKPRDNIDVQSFIWAIAQT